MSRNLQTVVYMDGTKLRKDEAIPNMLLEENY